jgi:hypothetical protein
LSDLQFIRNYRLEIDDANGVRHVFREKTPGTLNPVVGQEIVEGLRISFEVTEDLWGFPSMAKITVYNMGRDRIKQLQSAYSKIRLSVSYGDNQPKILFTGKVVNILALRQNETSYTEFYCTHAYEAYTFATISKTWAEKTPLKTIVRDIMATMPDITGGSLSALDGIILPDAYTGFGHARYLLARLSEAYGFWWTIQLGEMFIIKKNGTLLEEDAIVITKNSGMIGSPTITEIGINVTALLNPDLRPFKLIKVESVAPQTNMGNLYVRNLQNTRTLGTGIYRIQRVVHTGDTWENTWQSDIVGRDFFGTNTDELESEAKSLNAARTSQGDKPI